MTTGPLIPDMPSQRLLGFIDLSYIYPCHVYPSTIRLPYVAPCDYLRVFCFSVSFKVQIVMRKHRQKAEASKESNSVIPEQTEALASSNRVFEAMSPLHAQHLQA